MQTILVPTDFSDNSENAFKYALELALATKGKIILFHAYHFPTPASEIPIIIEYDELEKENLAHLKEFSDNLVHSKHRSIEIECLTKPGFAVQEIENLGSERKVDLIIMGKGKEGRLSEIILGSNTIGLIKKGKFPVLSVPEDYKYKPPQRIVFAVDENEMESPEALHILKELIRVYHSNLLLFNVIDQEEQVLAGQKKTSIKLEKHFADVKHTLHFYEDKDVVDGINRFAESNNADLIVMIPRKHNLFYRIFVENFTPKVVSYTQLPLLTLPEKT